MKRQDALGIVSAVGITVIAVVFVLAENISNDDIPQMQTQNTEIIGIGGITETKESIKISLNTSSIDLDSSNGLLRANVKYEGYQPQMGRILLEVYSSTGEKIKASELQLRQRGNGVYEADFTQHFDRNEFQANMLGQYIMRVSTDNGGLAKQIPFSITMSSQEQPKQILAVESNVIIGMGGILPEKLSNIGFDIELMETDLENTIIKKYLTKILKEYYNGDISKDDIKRLTGFKNIDCNITNQKSQTGEGLQLLCDIKSDN